MVTNNVSVEEGLCNGTRVQVLKLYDNIIRCKILTGTHKGAEHDMHKARFQFGDDPRALQEGPIRCERIQFPLRPGSVMTINKSQGKTISLRIFLKNKICRANIVTCRSSARQVAVLLPWTTLHCLVASQGRREHQSLHQKHR